ADASDAVDVGGAQPKKRTFRKFSYRGVDLDQLLDMGLDELVKLFDARARRRFQRGLKRKPMALIKKLRKAVYALLFYAWTDVDGSPVSILFFLSLVVFYVFPVTVLLCIQQERWLDE
ncbi:hypothetical protein B296_00030499, partial [Ensete ventricosum]